MCGRATNVILAPSAGCKGFARPSVTSVPARKADKLWQIIRVPGSSLTIICCAGISCVGCRKLAYSYGSFEPRELKKVPIGTRDSALRVAKKYENTQGKKRKPRQMVASCSPKLRSGPTFKLAFFLPLGPHSGSGAVPRTPALPGYCGGIAGM